MCSCAWLRHIPKSNDLIKFTCNMMFIYNILTRTYLVHAHITYSRFAYCLISYPAMVLEYDYHLHRVF